MSILNVPTYAQERCLVTYPEDVPLALPNKCPSNFSATRVCNGNLVTLKSVDSCKWAAEYLFAGVVVRGGNPPPDTDIKDHLPTSVEIMQYLRDNWTPKYNCGGMFNNSPAPLKQISWELVIVNALGKNHCCPKDAPKQLQIIGDCGINDVAGQSFTYTLLPGASIRLKFIIANPEKFCEDVRVACMGQCPPHDVTPVPPRLLKNREFAGGVGGVGVVGDDLSDILLGDCGSDISGFTTSSF